MWKNYVKKLSDRLPFNARYELFYQMAKTLGISHYAVRRDYGEFIGPLYDQSVIKPYMREGSFSKNIVDLIVNNIKEKQNATFIDIGANIGIVTIKVASQTAANCIAIEPDDGNFRILKANLALNAIDSVRLLNAAVGDKPGKAQFTRSAFNSGDHRMSPAGEQSVDVTALDDADLIQDAAYLVIKMDTQGAEPLIFTGGKATLAKADLIIAEFWPWGMHRMGVNADPVISFVEETQRGGYLLRHGQDVASAAYVPSADIVRELRAMAADPTEHAQLDLVLVK